MTATTKTLNQAINAFGSQKKVAEAIGVARESVNRYINKARRVPVKVEWALQLVLLDRKYCKLAKAGKDEYDEVLSLWSKTFIDADDLEAGDKFMETLTEQGSIPEAKLPWACFCLTYCVEYYKANKQVETLVRMLEQEKCGHL